MPLTRGSNIGVYKVTGPLGAGGMGEVHRARDTNLDRDVALKVLPDAFTADPGRRARFEREAKVLASLNHPNIAQIYGFEEESGGARALVLELVEGPTVADLVARGPVALDDALQIARQIASALQAAHEAGVVHRDLKPANVKVREDGTVKVLDFGLAKALDPEPAPAEEVSQPPTLTASATRMGVVMGTPAYMSPEQAVGAAVDTGTDLWSFGVLLYEMLAGERLFGGGDGAARAGAGSRPRARSLGASAVHPPARQAGAAPLPRTGPAAAHAGRGRGDQRSGGGARAGGRSGRRRSRRDRAAAVRVAAAHGVGRRRTGHRRESRRGLCSGRSGPSPPAPRRHRGQAPLAGPVVPHRPGRHLRPLAGRLVTGLRRPGGAGPAADAPPAGRGRRPAPGRHGGRARPVLLAGRGLDRLLRRPRTAGSGGTSSTPLGPDEGSRLRGRAGDARRGRPRDGGELGRRRRHRHRQPGRPVLRVPAAGGTPETVLSGGDGSGARHLRCASRAARLVRAAVRRGVARRRVASEGGGPAGGGTANRGVRRDPWRPTRRPATSCSGR